jgi:hypothetical protein
VLHQNVSFAFALVPREVNEVDTSFTYAHVRMLLFISNWVESQSSGLVYLNLDVLKGQAH